MSKSRLLVLAIAAVIGIAILVFRPFGGQSVTPSASVAKDAQPLTELKVGLAELGDITTLDPAQAASTAALIAVWQMYDRLVDIGADGRLLPMLATEWRSSDGLRRWHFRLRQGVMFHGAASQPPREVNAQDVRATIERAVQVAGLGRSLLSDVLVGIEAFVEGKTAHIAGIATGPDEIVFTLKKPFAFFPERMAASFFGIVPAGTPTETNAPPSGSGPYRLTAWDRAAGRIVLEHISRNWDSSSSAPQRLVFFELNSTSAGAQEIREGTIDWLEGPSTLVDLLRGAPSSIHVQTPPHTNIKLVAFNATDIVFQGEQGRKLRQALNLALDRHALAEMIGGGTAVIGPIPNGLWAEIGIPGNDERAQALIDSLPAKHRQLTLMVQPGSEERLIAEAMARQWRQVGLAINLEQGQADFWDRVIGGRYQAALAYFGPFLDMPEQYLWAYRKDAQPVPNAMRYYSKQFEDAYAAYISAGDKASQDKYLRAAIGALVENPPVAWLIQTPRVLAERARLKVPRVADIPVFYRAVAR